MPQVRGVKGEAVVIYCEPLTTNEVSAAIRMRICEGCLGMVAKNDPSAAGS